MVFSVIIFLFIIILIITILGFLFHYKKNWLKINWKKISAIISSGILIGSAGVILTNNNPPGDEICYYVSSSDGNDADNGLTIETAWQNISYVNDKFNDATIKSGDNIYFKCGDIFDDTYLVIKTGGTTDNWMTIGCYGDGNLPNINDTTYGILITTDNINYTKVENIRITNTSSAGIYCYNIHSYIWFYNLSFYNCAAAIFVNETDYCTIENCDAVEMSQSGFSFTGSLANYISNSKMLNCSASYVRTEDGFMIHEGSPSEFVGSNFLIKNCISSYNAEQGYDLVGTGKNIAVIDCISHHNNVSSFLIGSENSYNITIDGFFSYDEIGSGDADAICINNDMNEIIIRNSVFYNFDDRGIEASTTNPVTNLSFYNNDIIYGPDSTNNGLIINGDISNKYWLFKNNIIASMSSSLPTNGWVAFYNYVDPSVKLYLGNMSSNFTSNIWGRMGGTSATGSWWQYNNTNVNFAIWDGKAETFLEINYDPEIYNPLIHNFNLNSTSKCIDNGSWLTVTTDSGTGTTITVAEASYFMDGYGLTDGDIIFIGDDDNLEITDIDYILNTITVDHSITWSNGENISLSNFCGNKVDIGAEEYGIYNTTIRTYGLDYFIWMGDNTTASVVEDDITGFDTSEEYLAIWTTSASWSKYYGDGNGNNWDIHTFDVVQTYLNDSIGNITFDMVYNPDIDYDADRIVNLIKTSYGFNYTGYTNSDTATTMQDINTSHLELPNGYWLALWNDTLFKWDYWISGWAGNINQVIDKYDVIATRIDNDKIWTI